MIEKLIKKISHSQAFSPEDKLGRMVKEYDMNELAVENLDMVYAARKDDVSYDEFLQFAKEKDGKR